MDLKSDQKDFHRGDCDSRKLC